MREREMSSSIPQLLTCPISLELFSDPVTLCTGQTYDRCCILKWFAAGNLTCPVTMQKLHDLSLVPNHTLTHLIHQWLLNNHHDFHQLYHTNNNNGNVVSLISYKKLLLSHKSSLEQKMHVIEQVDKFISEEEEGGGGRIGIQGVGGFLSILLGFVFGGKYREEMMVLVEKSLDCALKLMPFCCNKDLNLLMEDSNFENFKLLLFQQESFMVKVRLCNFIDLIFTTIIPSSSSSSKEDDEEQVPVLLLLLANKIGNDNKVIQGLISSVNDYQNQQSVQVSEASMKAILGILSVEEDGTVYRENMVKEGVVDALVRYIIEVVEGKEKRRLLGGKATKGLERVLELESGKQRFFIIGRDDDRGVKALIKMVFRVSAGDDEGSESAVKCLMELCCESVEVREAAVSGGILTQLLLLLQSQCGMRVKTRARMLLKLLRSMWVKDPKHV